MEYLIWFLILAAVALVLLLRQAWYLIRVRACTEEVVGVVTELEESKWHGQRITHRSLFYVHVAYDGGGERQYGRTRQLFRFDDYAERMSVRVWVDPKEPTHFVMEGEKNAAGREIAIYVALLLVIALVVGVVETQNRIDEERWAERQAAMESYIAEKDEKILTEVAENDM